MSRRRVNRFPSETPQPPLASDSDTVDLEVYQALMQQYNDLRQWVTQLEADLQAAHEAQVPVVEIVDSGAGEELQQLRSQLMSSRERVAAMERACADRQQQLGSQEQQLVLLQEEARSLRERLEWHQRYAAQLKSALERCMESDRPPAAVPAPEPVATNSEPAVSGPDADWPSPRILPRRRTASSVELPRFVRLS